MMATTQKQTVLTLLNHDKIAEEADRLLGYAAPISFDIETTGFDPRTEKLVLLSWKAPGARSLVIDARSVYEGNESKRQELARLISPLFYGEGGELWGHNLQFDLYWMLVHLGIESKAHISDTMLRELLILGAGFGESRVDLKSTGERYGIPVSKDERMWFPGLDKRLELRDASGTVLDTCTVEEDAGRRKELKIKHFTEVSGHEEDTAIDGLLAAGWAMPWYEPIPEAQLEYARQDVVVTILVHKAQEGSLKEQGLQEVESLESRVLPAVVSMRSYGVGVDRDAFSEVLHDVHEKSEELAVQLHEVLDVPILKARQASWNEQSAPHQEWQALRDQYMASVEIEWEQMATEEYTKKDGTLARRTTKDYQGPKWGVVKKEALAMFKEQFPEPKHPGPLKYGVNLNSPAQIVTGFKGIGLLVGSADQKVLTQFSTGDDLIAKTVRTYLSYSDYKTVEKRWGNGWMDENLVPEEHIDHTTGEVTQEWRWYVDWQQIGASTGRFSSGFQQVNKRGPGAGLRKAFVPRKGYKFVVADFSNIELRIAAALSGDPFLLAAFASGLDLHTYTAEIMFDLQNNAEYMAAKAAGTAKEWADTTDAVVGGHVLLNVHYRDIAKTINFSVLYGAGVRNLAGQLHVAEGIARQLKQIHYAAFHVVLDWIDQQGRRATGYEARNAGKIFSTTRSGRRRWFTMPTLEVTKEMSGPEVREAQDKYKAKIAEIKRSLANAPVQGTSADVTKLTIALWYETYESPDMHLVFTLHDENAIECVDDDTKLATARNGLRWCMLEAMRVYIPEVDPGEVEPVISAWWRH
jgi:DNA polymerase-1